MRRVLIVAFDGVATLDVTGPADVFASAVGPRGEAHYRVEVTSMGGGPRTTGAALVIETTDLRRVRLRRSDLVLVAGAERVEVLAALGDHALLAWLRRAATKVRDIGSVCSGAFVLAAAGLLDGRRATTHWAGCAALAEMFPNVHVDRNAIFVCDGRFWTSAGVTTGIDMALAIVERDLGRSQADAIAKKLVLYLRRPGFQAQFSDALVAQLDTEEPLGRAVEWIRGHLREASVEGVARASAVSVRTLHRRCLEQAGVTPAKLIERLRVERARVLLVTSQAAMKAVALLSGFQSSTHLRRAFERELGVAPREYRLLHAPARALGADPAQRGARNVVPLVRGEPQHVGWR